MPATSLIILVVFIYLFFTVCDMVEIRNYTKQEGWRQYNRKRPTSYLRFLVKKQLFTLLLVAIFTAGLYILDTLRPTL